MVLDNNHFKKFNACLYKFLWNRHFEAAKAPERIKRDIINTPINLGGFGMLDVKELDEGLKLKALGRLISTKHPFLNAVKLKIKWDNFFCPWIDPKVEAIAHEGIALLKKDRLKLLGLDKLEGNLKYLNLLGDTRISAIISELGKNSLAYFAIVSRGARKLGELDRREIELIGRHLPAAFLRETRKNIDLLRPNQVTASDQGLYYTGAAFKDLEKMSSKEIRTARSSKDPISLYKIGMVLNPGATLAWGNQLRKLTSARHKNVLLRVAHGEIYTNERLFKFHLADDAKCVNCDQVETLTHKVYECPYADRIWKETFRKTNQLRINPNENLDTVQRILGATENSSNLLITIHAEILSRILAVKSSSNYMVLPRLMVNSSLKFLRQRERNQAMKNLIDTLLEQ